MNEFKVFTDSDDMSEFLSSQNEMWVNVPIENIEFESGKDGIYAVLELPDITLTHSIRPCAWESIYRRCRIGGAALEDVAPEIKADILNKCAAVADLDTKILVVNDKINCMLSGENSKNGDLNYSELPAKEVFRQTEYKLAEISGDPPASFIGYWNYSGIYARWLLANKVPFNGEELNVQVTLATSDIGKGAIVYSIALAGKGKVLPICSPLTVTHRRKNTDDTVLITLDMMQAVLDESMNQIDLLDRVIVQNPVSTMKRVAKEVRLPKGIALKVIEQYRATHGNVPSSAKMLFITLCDVVMEYEAYTSNPRYVNEVRNNIAKLKGINWEKYDLPGEFAW